MTVVLILLAALSFATSLIIWQLWRRTGTLGQRIHRQNEAAIDHTVTHTMERCEWDLERAWLVLELEETRAELGIAEAEIRRLTAEVAVTHRTKQGRAS